MAPLRVETFGDLGAAPAEEWDRLAERSGTIFATREWAELWWRHFGSGTPHVALARDAGGRGSALVALEMRGSRPLRIGRFVGHGAADQLGPVCAPGEPTGVAILEAVRGEIDLLLAERLPGSGWADRIGGRVLQREPSPVVAAPEGGWEAFLAGRSSNFRSQVRRKERKLLRDHGLTYRLVDDPDAVGPAIDALVELYHARWGGRGSEALDPARAAFHRDFAAVALRRGWLRLWIAEIEGRAVAAWYGFRFGGAEAYYQSGRDPAWDRESVGLVLLAHTIREAMNDGVHEYKLLRGGESYKDRFATGDEGLETVVAGTPAVAGLAAAAGPSVIRARRALRQLRRRASVFL